MAQLPATGNEIVLLDATSYLYRGYHAAPAVVNSKGQQTGAITAFLKMFGKLKRLTKTERIIMILDADGPCFRHEIYPEYKAQRDNMPVELASQITALQLIIEAMGYPMIRHPGVEADDVIATLAKQITSAGETVIISSPDKDLCQLVNDKVIIYNASKDEIYDRQGAINRVGVPPELILDYLAIVGDKSDNIPGIKGIGDKSATTLLNEIGPLKSIYANLDAIDQLSLRGKASIKNKLFEQRDNARLSYALATLKTDVVIPISISESVKQEDNTVVLQWLYKSLELKI